MTEPTRHTLDVPGAVVASTARPAIRLPSPRSSEMSSRRVGPEHRDLGSSD